MNTQNEVLNKLNAFVTYSSAQKSEYAIQYESLMQPLLLLVKQYFTGDRSAFKIPLNNLEHDFYNDIIKRQTVYEKSVDFKMSANFPPAYNDLRLLFYTFPCMDVDNSTFYGAWVEGVDELTGENTVLNNTLIDSWVASLNTAISDELKNVNALMDWLENASSDASMVMLWEETGLIKSQPTTKQIADMVFNDKHLNECIEKLNLPAYKPTYK